MSSSSASTPKSKSTLPHNPNRPVVPPPGSPARPYTISHPLFTYTTRVPLRTDLIKHFPSPYLAEPDFTASPPLFYSHAAPVERCMEEHMRKYPHPSVPEILSSEMTSDTVDPQTGIRHRSRLIKCKNIAPWIFRKMLGTEFVYLREDSQWNPKTREFHMQSENQTYSNLVYAKEQSRFVPHPENPREWTSFVQYGGIRCNSYLGPAKRPIEKIVCERMIKGGLQAADLLDDVLNSQSPF